MKPRVLIVNKFYYRRGGDCIYSMNLEALLRTHGCETAVFAMRHPRNIPSEWDGYWPAEVTFAGGASSKIKAMRRTMGWDSTGRLFRRMVRDFRPDVIHLNNIHSYLSPVVLEEARKARIPVVWTLHDYKLVCPAYACLREGKICEECFTRSSAVLRTRCMKGSAAASALAWAEARRWNKRKLGSLTGRFICPSAFMAQKMREGGFSGESLTVLCNFIPPEAEMQYRELARRDMEREPYYCYVGRLSEEKGVRTLLKVASRLPYTLRIAGGGPLEEELRRDYGHMPNIEFLGHLNAGEVGKLLAKARLMVIPSVSNENNPLTVIESLCAGTPVAGASTGGIPELISPDTGTIFSAGSADDMARAITDMMENHGRYDNAAISSRSLERFSSARYFDNLMKIYTDAVKR